MHGSARKKVMSVSVETFLRASESWDHCGFERDGKGVNEVSGKLRRSQVSSVWKGLCRGPQKTKVLQKHAQIFEGTAGHPRGMQTGKAREWISMRVHRQTRTPADRHMWVGALSNR